jgi:hypothetical protein
MYSMTGKSAGRPKLRSKRPEDRARERKLRSATVQETPQRALDARRRTAFSGRATPFRTEPQARWRPMLPCARSQTERPVALEKICRRAFSLYRQRHRGILLVGLIEQERPMVARAPANAPGLLPLCEPLTSAVQTPSRSLARASPNGWAGISARNPPSSRLPLQNALETRRRFRSSRNRTHGSDFD